MVCFSFQMEEFNIRVIGETVSFMGSVHSTTKLRIHYPHPSDTRILNYSANTGINTRESFWRAIGKDSEQSTSLTPKSSQDASKGIRLTVMELSTRKVDRLSMEYGLIISFATEHCCSELAPALIQETRQLNGFYKYCTNALGLRENPHFGKSHAEETHNRTET